MRVLPNKGTFIFSAADRCGKDECPLYRTKRRGLSLLEVLVALSIFLFSLIVIGRLVTVGGDRALDVQEKGQAAQLCQSKLAEVVAGVVALSSQSDVPFDEDPNWYWSVDCEQGSVTGVWNVSVRVSRTRSDGSKIESSLQQLVLDPSIRGSTADAAAAASSSSSSDTTGSSTTGTASATGNTTTAAPAPSGGTTAAKTATPAASPATNTGTTGKTSSGSSGSKTGGR